MIEGIMFFGLGFLVASLIALIIVPLVHARAVRLTTRRVQASAPLSIAEIQADKDQLRAEFAMSTRRLEMSVEQLKAKTTGQLAELGKKAETVSKLKAELGEKTATIFALEAREKALQDQLRTTEEELGRKTTSLHEAERKLAEKEAEFGSLGMNLDERSASSDSQRIEMVALRTQVATLRDQVADLEQQIKQAEGRQLGDANREREQLRADIAAAHRLEQSLRDELASAEQRHEATAQAIRAEKAMVEGQLERAREERGKLQQEIAALKRNAESSWESERMENALLRERINDVSAEVASLTATLEGAESPIVKILAGDSAANDESLGGSQNGTAPIGLPRANGSLADRIRALQSRAASRAATSP